MKKTKRHVCRGCAERTPGCHDRCPKYLAESIITFERQQERNRILNAENMLTDMAVKKARALKKGVNKK